MLLLGIDLGSSYVKAAVFDTATGVVIGAAQYPPQEMTIHAPQPGWAEQDPAEWWEAVQQAVRDACLKLQTDRIGAIGIAYQMHGLVCIDPKGRVLRPAIIWCDSRGVEIGRKAAQAIGPEKCHAQLLNLPGNFTASKLRWVKLHEPDIYSRIDKILLPGDYLAYLLTGRAATSISGLSEGMFWDFSQKTAAGLLLRHFEISSDLLPELVPTFGFQGELTAAAADALGLKPGIPITYRAGDQPNNAFSLNVLLEGQTAATAGTSGVLYSVGRQIHSDPQSRVNTFAHVNYSRDDPYYGVLLCINGAAIMYAWLRKNLALDLDYSQMDQLAAKAPVGSAGVSVLPFGNGAERMFANREIGAHVCGLDLNRHGKAHLCRAVQEGIAYSFCYGLEIMRQTGVKPAIIRAGMANMFLSPVFQQTLADASGVALELYATDGAQGAARGAGVGAGIFNSYSEALASLKLVHHVDSNPSNRELQMASYHRWLDQLKLRLGSAS